MENKKKQKALNLIAYLILSSVVLHYFYLIYKYSINFPYFDDYYAILNFLNKWVLIPEINDRITLLFSQWNEHRIVFARIVTLSEYVLLGQVNFRLLILFGNSALIVILIYVYKSFLLKHKVSLLYLIPVSLLLFNFRYYEISFWAMATLSSLWVLSFAIMSFYFLFKENNYSIYLSMFFAVIATFTIANGMMVFFAGAFVLILNKGFLKQKKILWFLFGVTLMLFYFHDYVKPDQHPNIIKPLLNDPLSFILYIFGFLGNAFSSNLKHAIPIGVILSFFILYITYKKYYKENPVLYSIIIFIVITSVLAALTRLEFGLRSSLSSRYTIYSTLLTVCCYLAFISMVEQKVKGIYVSLITIIVFTFNYKTKNAYLHKKIAYKEQFELYENKKSSAFDLGWDKSKWSFPNDVIKLSDSLGVFHFKHLKDLTSEK